jgi:NADPH:quinone reductase
MQAIVFDQAGEPSDVLRVADVPDPTPSDGMALVRVAARPIHPADLAFIRGQYRMRPTFPQVAGLEGCGEVIASPAGSPFRSGMRVAFRCPGTWAELVAVPVDRLIEVPADIAETAACQASLNPMTSWALLDESGAQTGDWVLLTAATSVVSNLVAQIAQPRGIHTVGLVRGNLNDNKPRCAADQVVTTQNPDVLKTIRDVVGKAAITALLDSVGGPLTAKLMTVLAPGANVVAYGVQDREPAAVTNAVLVYSNLTWKGFGIDRWLSQHSAEAKAEMIAEIWTMIRDQTVRLPVASSHRLTAIVEALAADSKPGRTGKVILA